MLLTGDSSMKSVQDSLLTRPQAAELLGVKVQTLAAWAVDGRYGLPFVKVGRSVRYRRSEIEAFIERRTVGSAVQAARM